MHDPHPASHAPRALHRADRRGGPRPAPADLARRAPLQGPGRALDKARPPGQGRHRRAGRRLHRRPHRRRRLNLLFPGAWKAPTDALPLEMRLTHRNADGTLTPIRLTDQGEVMADQTLYYRCRLALAGAAFEDVGAGDDPKAAYSDAIKRVAVRAGIGESLYAMDSPWLRVGDADNQLRVSRVGKPYLDERTTRWLRRMYEAWLTRAGAIFGEPLPHAPAPTLPGAPETTADDAPAAQTIAPAVAGARDAADGNLTAVSAPEIPDIPGPAAAGVGAEPAAEEPARPAGEDASSGALPDEARVSDAVRQMIAAAHATGSPSCSPRASPTPSSSSRTSTTSSPPSSRAASCRRTTSAGTTTRSPTWSRRPCAPSATAPPRSGATRSATTSTDSRPKRRPTRSTPPPRPPDLEPALASVRGRRLKRQASLPSGAARIPGQ